ncbi:MAG: putative toxin-antitoxin system toxin component, PIN family [Candidatus Competibacter sp.]
MNSDRKRVVLDTNILISAAINAKSLPAFTVMRSFETCDVYCCQETFDELAEVIFRPKLDKYFRGQENRYEFLELMKLNMIPAEITLTVTDCPDPKDNKFLALARSVNAHFLVSGDKKHLLSMNPYHGIAIMNIAEFYAVLFPS